MTRTEKQNDQPAPDNPAPGEDASANPTPAADPQVSQLQDFVDQLTEEERMLVLLQHELYEQSWSAMLADLRSRLNGKPYIFKLVTRIREDIERIEKLQAFEQENNLKLADFVEPPKP